MSRLLQRLVMLVAILACGTDAYTASTQLPIPVQPLACPGCCSSHGGISSSCGFSGRILCNDGTISPTCLCSSCGVSSTPPPPPASCSYTYSNWLPCQSDGTQTRSVASSFPSGCVGTPGPLVQSCVYTTALNYTALWWNPNESGWGININQQSNTLFATLFAYATDKAPMWLVASNLIAQTNGSFTGPLYRVTGPMFSASPWSAVSPSQVGNMTVQFTSDHTATLVYTVGLTTVIKNIEKQIFSTPTTCIGTTGSRASATNYQDLWWNPQESGWGMNLTQQGGIIFATLFTYDATGRDLWLVASNLTKQGDGSFSGALYSTTGPAFGSQAWEAIGVNQVGTMSLRFLTGDSGTLTYSVNGTVVVKSIQRQVFGVVLPMCQ